MCVGSVITELTIEAEPETVVYEVGQTFDANGLRVMAKYANGVRADVTKDVSFSREPLTGEDTEFTLSYGLGEYEEMYQNRDGQTGVQYHIPTATLDLTIYEDHLWDEGAVTKAPTCVEPGEIIHCCTLCGETRTEEIPATGQHSWDEGHCYQSTHLYGGGRDHPSPRPMRRDENGADPRHRPACLGRRHRYKACHRDRGRRNHLHLCPVRCRTGRVHSSYRRLRRWSELPQPGVYRFESEGMVP